MRKVRTFYHPEFKSIHGVNIDGKPGLLGEEIAALAGYDNPSEAIMSHVDEEDRKFVMLPKSDSQNGEEVETAVINRYGLHSLFFSRKFPNRKRILSLIEKEILPALERGTPMDLTPVPQAKKEENSKPHSESDKAPENPESELQTFEHPEFGKIRALRRDGKPWFVGKDVAAALGYSNPHDALANHVNNEDTRL